MIAWTGLVDVLLDRTARFDERDDAALDLGEHDEPAVVEALRRVAMDPEEDEVLRATCAASLGEISARTSRHALDFRDLPEPLRAEADATFDLLMISRLLLRYWDPLRVGDTDAHRDGEYRHEAHQVLALLREDAGVNEVRDFLIEASRDLSREPSSATSQKAAEALVDWWDERLRP